jgi:lipopolysaccharide export system permease protein
MSMIDRLVLREIRGPWVFGVLVFTVLVTAGSFLYEFTRFLSQGADWREAILLIGLLLPGVVAKTFSMAMLLGTLLAFGRLSGDSEITALRAAGVSMARIMLPVGAFGLAVAIAGFLMGEYLVPAAAYRAEGLRDSLKRFVEKGRQTEASWAVMEDSRLKANLTAKDFDLAQNTLNGVTMVFYDAAERPSSIMWVASMRFQDGALGDTEKMKLGWRIQGEAVLYDLGTGSIARFQDAYPQGIESPDVTPENLVAARLGNLDAFSMTEIEEQIKELRSAPNPDEKQIANLRFGYWNKIALPLAALVFGLVGAPLGIRGQRAGSATGFWLSVIIIFFYTLLTNVLSIAAQGGRTSPWLASFLPIFAGLAAAIWLIRRKDG